MACVEGSYGITGRVLFKAICKGVDQNSDCMMHGPCAVYRLCSLLCKCVSGERQPLAVGSVPVPDQGAASEQPLHLSVHVSVPLPTLGSGVLATAPQTSPATSSSSSSLASRQDVNPGSCSSGMYSLKTLGSSTVQHVPSRISTAQPATRWLHYSELYARTDDLQSLRLLMQQDVHDREHGSI